MATERQELEREIGRSLATQLLAQRDQLRQGLQGLLAGVKAMEDAPIGRREERESDLYKLADQVRKELGEG